MDPDSAAAAEGEELANENDVEERFGVPAGGGCAADRAMDRVLDRAMDRSGMDAFEMMSLLF